MRKEQRAQWEPRETTCAVCSRPTGTRRLFEEMTSVRTTPGRYRLTRVLRGICEEHKEQVFGFSCRHGTFGECEEDLCIVEGVMES